MTNVMLLGILLLLLAQLRELRTLRREVQRHRRTNIFGSSDEDFSHAEEVLLASWERFINLAEGPKKDEEKQTHDWIWSQLDRARQFRADVICGKKTIEEARAEMKPGLFDFLMLGSRSS
jgi:hypothetical protein